MKKPHSLFRRLLALALVLSLLVMPLPMRAQAEGADSQLVLESKSLSAFASGSKTDGEAEKINDTFTILWSAKSKVDTSAKTWEDGYASEQRINFGGKVSTEKNAVRFETPSAAVVKVWWVQGGDDNREMAILNADGEIAAITSGTYVKNSPYISELELSEGGVWYLGSATNNNIYKE